MANKWLEKHDENKSSLISNFTISFFDAVDYNDFANSFNFSIFIDQLELEFFVDKNGRIE